MDLSKIPTEDLKAIQSGKWSEVSTPGLQAYQQARQHDAQASQQAQNPQQVPDSADKAAQNNSPNAKPITLQGQSQKILDASGFSSEGRQRVQQIQEQTGPKGAQQLATTLVPGSASALSQGAGVMGRVGTAALAGGTTAVGVKDPDAAPSDKLKSFLAGGAVGGTMQGAGELAGKLGDYLMQKSVGMRKYNPGVGISLANQGVVGTKNMMANQVENKLGGEEQRLQDIVQNLKGTVNSKEIADAVGNKAKQFTLPSTGQASPYSQLELNKVRDMSEQLSKMGDLSASDLLALKRQGDYQGYTAGGNTATSTEADLGRVGANAARTALKKMSPDVADSLLKEQALVKANTALSKPETIHQGNGSSLFFGKLPGQSVLESLLGQAGVQGGKVLNSPNTQRATEQGLFGN